MPSKITCKESDISQENVNSALQRHQLVQSIKGLLQTGHWGCSSEVYLLK